MKRVLVTGGAGFIGSHLCDALLAMGCEVMAFDCLQPQVHPLRPNWPSYLKADGSKWLDQPGLQPWFGDVRDQQAVYQALMSFKPDTVIHLAALVGVGQSNEKIADYTSCNITGTAVLMNCLVNYNTLVDDRAASLIALAEEQEVIPQATDEFVEEPRLLNDDVIQSADEMRFHNEETMEMGDWVPVKEDMVGLNHGSVEFEEYWGGFGCPDMEIRRPSELEKRFIMETQDEAEARYLAWRIQTEAELRELPEGKVEQVFIAGSMSSYGEGAYVDSLGLILSRVPIWKDGDGISFSPRGLKETDSLLPASVYASNKAEQERLALIIGKTRGLDVRVGRFFNVYGTRQALSNPYTGVGAIFAARAMSGLAPRVYEDGLQSRDFIHVSDLVSGIITIIDKGSAGEVYNVGTGVATTIGWLAEAISTYFEAPAPEITGQVRTGDIRNAFANVDKLRSLGWTNIIHPEDGVRLLCDWAKDQDAESASDLDKAHNDLIAAKLL